MPFPFSADKIITENICVASKKADGVEHKIRCQVGNGSFCSAKFDAWDGKCATDVVRRRKEVIGGSYLEKTKSLCSSL